MATIVWKQALERMVVRCDPSRAAFPARPATRPARASGDNRSQLTSARTVHSLAVIAPAAGFVKTATAQLTLSAFGCYLPLRCGRKIHGDDRRRKSDARRFGNR
jgi:hypothetical protein